MSSISLITTYLDTQERYTKKYGDKTIVLMQVGSFHEAYATDTRGHNLFKLASILNMVCTKKDKEKEVSEQYPYMVGFPTVAKSKYIKILVDNSFTVVIIDQVTPPPNPQRDITGIYSPGTYIDNTNIPDSNNIVAFYIEEEKQLTGKLLTCIGMSVVDLSTGNSYVYEVYSSIEDNNYAFNESLRFIYSYNPKETLVFHKKKKIDNELTKEKIIYNLELDDKLHHYYDMSHKSYKEFEKISYQEEFFKKIYDEDGIHNIIQNLELDKYIYARISLIGLLNYAYQHDNSITKELNKPGFFSNEKHVVLGNNAVMQLNVIDNSSLDTGNSTVKSLFDTINNTSTAMGRRYLKARLVNPLTSIKELTKLYNYTESIIKDKCYKIIESYLKLIIDIERLYRKILLDRIHPFEFAQFITSYQSVNTLINYIATNKELIELLPTQYEYINEFCNEVDNTFIISELKKQNITDMDKSFFVTGIYPEVDKLQEKIDYQNRLPSELCIELSKLIEDSEFVKKQVRKKHVDEHKDYNSLEDKDYNKVKKRETKEGISLIITKIRYNSLKEALKKINKIDILGHEVKVSDLIFTNLKDCIKITLPMLDEIHKNITNKTDKLKESLFNCYKKTLSNYKDKYGKVFASINDFVAIIDFIKSNAKSAKMYNYVKPIINYKENSYIDCKDLRHPIIERIIDYDYVPHTVELGNDLKGMLVYGINSCGKCFSAKTKILLSDGTYKYAKNIATGDLLMGDDSTKRTVLNTIQGKDWMFKISFDKYSEFSVTGEHILCLKKIEGGDITEITVNEYMKNKNYYKNYCMYTVPIEFAKQKINVNPYNFGTKILHNKYTGNHMNNIKYNTKSVRIAFLQGLQNCEFSCIQRYKKGHIFKFPINTSSRLIEDIKFILRSLGFIVHNMLFMNLYFYGNDINSYMPYKEHLFNFSIKKYKKDYYYGFEVDGNKRFLLHNMIVTHNSSLMKSIGLSVIMAQSGMFVPANKYTFSPYNSIYARITGNDNIFKGQSSFTLEMTEMNSILNRSDKNTLVIGDEPAKGTESLSANALVASAVVRLAKVGATFIFATHLHDIPKLQVVKDLNNVKTFHLSVEYDHNKDILIFNRELKEGSGDPIYGITVANKIIRDKEFISLANSIKSELLKNYNSIMPGKKSRYNSNLYIVKCSLCNKDYEYNKEDSQGNIDTHHITHQADYRNNNVSVSRNHIQKNQLSNLVTLCKKCHKIIHEENIDIGGYVKTSKGKQLIIKQQLN